MWTDECTFYYPHSSFAQERTEIRMRYERLLTQSLRRGTAIGVITPNAVYAVPREWWWWAVWTGEIDTPKVLLILNMRWN